jgi:hypothetical protein
MLNRDYVRFILTILIPYAGLRILGPVSETMTFSILIIASTVTVVTAVRERAQGMETREGQDPQGLGAKHDSPVGSADAPETPAHEVKG